MSCLKGAFIVSWIIVGLFLASSAWATVDTVLVADGDHDTFLSKAHAVYTGSCGGSAAATNTANTRIFVGDRESGGTYTNYKGLLRFDIKDLHGTVNSATLYMYSHAVSGGGSQGDVHVLRPHSYWWPGDSSDWTGAADTLSVKAIEDFVAEWNTFTLDTDFVPMGRYLDIRLEDEFQQTCDNPPGAGVTRWSIWRSKDYNGTSDDEFTPYLVVDYDSTTVTCASVYVPAGASDGYLEDGVAAPDICDGIEADVYTGATIMVAGEKISPDYASYGYIRFNLSAIPDSIQSAWMTFTIDALGVVGPVDFGNVELWKLDTDFKPLDASDWGASGTEIMQVLYDSLTVGETVSFDVTGYVTGGVKEPFQIQTSVLCDEIEPIGDETIWLRSSEYAGTSSDPVLTICYFPSVITRRYGPIVSHEPTANPMVKVSPTR